MVNVGQENKSEIIGTPETMPVAGNEAADHHLTYQRSDGTIEQATSPEDAIARCPVLGKLPVEQANVLLELAAVGKEQLAKEAENDALHDHEQVQIEREDNADTMKAVKIPKEKSEPDNPKIVKEQLRQRDRTIKKMPTKSNSTDKKRGKQRGNKKQKLDKVQIVRDVKAANSQTWKDYEINASGSAENLLVAKSLVRHRDMAEAA